MITYIFDCYVIRVEDQPGYFPPRKSVQIYTNGVQIEAFYIDAAMPAYDVLVAIFEALEGLPPCAND